MGKPLTKNGLLKVYSQPSKKVYRVAWIEDGEQREKYFSYNKVRTQLEAMALVNEVRDEVGARLHEKRLKRLDSGDLSLELTADDLN